MTADSILYKNGSSISPLSWDVIDKVSRRKNVITANDDGYYYLGNKKLCRWYYSMHYEGERKGALLISAQKNCLERFERAMSKSCTAKAYTRVVEEKARIIEEHGNIVCDGIRIIKKPDGIEHSHTSGDMNGWKRVEKTNVYIASGVDPLLAKSDDIVTVVEKEIISNLKKLEKELDVRRSRCYKIRSIFTSAINKIIRENISKQSVYQSSDSIVIYTINGKQYNMMLDRYTRNFVIGHYNLIQYLDHSTAIIPKNQTGAQSDTSANM